MDSHYSTPITCVGHSMGGIALLRAALREPERFNCIVLLDPVLFPPSVVRVWGLIFKLGLGEKVHPLALDAKVRRRQFDNLDRLQKGFRRKPVFKYFDDHALRNYVEAIACKTETGAYQLCYSPDWEIRIYITAVWRDMDLWRGLPKMDLPALIIRGAETNTFRQCTGNLVKRKQPGVCIEALEKSTHLVPLERPKEVANLIHSFVEENA